MKLFLRALGSVLLDCLFIAAVISFCVLVIIVATYHLDIFFGAIALIAFICVVLMRMNKLERVDEAKLKDAAKDTKWRKSHVDYETLQSAKDSKP